MDSFRALHCGPRGDAPRRHGNRMGCIGLALFLFLGLGSFPIAARQEQATYLEEWLGRVVSEVVPLAARDFEPLRGKTLEDNRITNPLVYYEALMRVPAGWRAWIIKDAWQPKRPAEFQGEFDRWGKPEEREAVYKKMKKVIGGLLTSPWTFRERKEKWDPTFSNDSSRQTRSTWSHPDGRIIEVTRTEKLRRDSTAFPGISLSVTRR